MSDTLIRPASGGLARLLASLHGAEGDAPLFDAEAARGEAYAAGLADGRAEALADTAAARESMARAAAALTTACAIDPAALRPMFTDLARRLCEAALLAELKLSPEALQPLVEAAAAAAHAHEPAVLRLHPDAVAALEPLDLAVAVRGDASLGRDEVVVDGPQYRLEVSLAARLAAIVEALG